MSTRLNSPLHFYKTWPLLAAAMVCVLGMPASAQELRSEGPPPSDPLLQWADQLAPRNQFYIDSDSDVEVIRFKIPHDMEVCAARGHASPEGHVRGYPIKVTWDAESAIVFPGNCLAFDARKASVRAASPLPQDIVLEGTFRVVK